MQVHVLCSDEPPAALVLAAQEVRNCLGCGGLIELDRFAGSWFATLAHARSCTWCSAPERPGPSAPVLRLADFRRT